MPKSFVVYLVDDDPDDQSFFSMALSRIDISCSCIFANNALEAIEKFTLDPGFTPDFIFIDINMPFMNGMECLTKLKRIDRLHLIPVYIYSTSNDPQMVENCIRIGATGIIQKLSSINALKEVLLEVFLKHKVLV